MSDSKIDEAKQLIELANFRLARWTDRRKHEWTISAGIWVALGGAGLSGKIVNVPLPALAAILLAFVIAHAFLWVGFNLVRNRRDLTAAFDYIAQAHSRLG